MAFDANQLMDRFMVAAGLAPPEYAVPGTEEFNRRVAAMQTQINGPEVAGVYGRAAKETFGGLGSSRAVGQQQAALAAALRAQAEGTGPSLAQLQYQSALEDAQAAAASQIASARGLSPAQAQRLALTQQAQSRAGAASQSAQLRLQEQLAAQSALGNLLGQQRQQELLGGQLASDIYGKSSGLGAQMAIEQARLGQRAKETVVGQGAEQQEQAAKLTATGMQTAGTVTGAIAGAARGKEIDAVVPGKAKFNGDTRSNDTVPALLSPGEIVLPRSVAQDEDAPEKAKKFVDAIKKQKRPSPKAFVEALSRIRDLESRLDAMEALADLESEQEG
jgi:hypothetical protein